MHMTRDDTSDSGATSPDITGDDVRPLGSVCTREIRHHCVTCGELFVLVRHDQECCSARCRRQKRRNRRRERIETLAAESQAVLQRLVAEAVKPD